MVTVDDSTCVADGVAYPEHDFGEIECRRCGAEPGPNDLCTHYTGGTVSPPDYCDDVREPGSEYCTHHREQTEALEALVEEAERQRELEEAG